ncbi:hypothetical protein VNO78_07714 [Psophocarpus tetragonolobus]|uniref:Uncharacterized protein n=1 Tax=Psophocarpus tetragonolobus TaxID=3891 RepID=A0AAN9SV33_PSOTE
MVMTLLLVVTLSLSPQSHTARVISQTASHSTLTPQIAIRHSRSQFESKSETAIVQAPSKVTQQLHALAKKLVTDEG